MKKIFIALIASMGLMFAGCTTSGGLGSLDGILNGLGGQSTINGLLNMVIGHVTISQDELIGSWHYNAPGCAFTSENLLAKAGGSVAAEKVKTKLQPAYEYVGVNASNTTFVFNRDNTFSARVDGIPMSGTYTYEPKSGTLKLKMLLMSATGYITRTTSGLALTFESKKLLSVLQTVSALSGNSTVKAVGDLSKEFDGVRVGFDLAK